MKHKGYKIKRSVIGAAAAALMLSLPCGCADKDKNEAESSVNIDSTIVYESRTEPTVTDGGFNESTDTDSSSVGGSADEYSSIGSTVLIPLQSSGKDVRSEELEYKVISIYNTSDIVTGDEHTTPSEDSRFFIAELELINNTDDMILFRSSFDVIPSVDDGVLSMSGYQHEFPLVLNGYNNLQSSLEIPVYKNSSVKGYIGFEGPLQFDTVELTFCSVFGVTDSFCFSKSGYEPEKKPVPLAKGDANGFETALYKCSVSDGSESGLSPAGDGFKYLSLTAEMKNISDSLLKADTNKLMLLCGETQYDNIFSDTNSLYVPPGKHIGRTTVMKVPAGADKFTIVQTGVKDTVLFEYSLPKQ